MRLWDPFKIYDFIDRIDAQYSRIEAHLKTLTRKVDHMSEQEQALNAELQGLGAKVDELVNAVDGLIARIPADSSIDLSDEIAAVQNAALKIQGVTDKATGAEEPPA